MTLLVAAQNIPAPMRTPLVQAGALWVKAEGSQRAKSAKYRMVYAKVLEAANSGAISPRTTLVEVTSGSTGIALAFVGKLLGVSVELHAYTTISPSKRRSIEDWGAHLVLHEPEVPVSRLLDAVREKVAQGGHWHLDQYARASTAQTYEPLGREILAQLHDTGAPPPQAFICPVGSGGLIQGVGTVLRNKLRKIRIVAVEPEAGHAIEGTRNTALFSLGELDPYDPDFPDEVVRVPSSKSWVRVDSVALGESGSAAYAVAASKDWGSALVMAPD